MEDKELKKKLAKVPDKDKSGDPIYKIDDESKEPVEESNDKKPGAAAAAAVPLFLSHIPDVSQGNLQDEKDKTKE